MRIVYLFIFLIFILFISSMLIINSNSPRLILYMENVYELPARFRMSTYEFPQESKEHPSKQGLAELNMSASAQFSEEGLRKIKDIIPKKKLFLIDLRQESHGFINGMGVSWYSKKDWANKGKTPEEVEKDQADRLKTALKDGFAIIFRKKIFPFPVTVHSVKSEAELAKELNVDYKRIYVTDHLRPDDESVDAFINLAKNIDSDTWIHIHCAAGKGRATTFMVMYDMMRNANQVSYNDILTRQLLIGGKDLSRAIPEKWQSGYAIERLEFLKKFYEYNKENPNFEKSWSDWVGNNNE